jgi:hypothetical protein
MPDSQRFVSENSQGTSASVHGLGGSGQVPRNGILGNWLSGLGNVAGCLKCRGLTRAFRAKSRLTAATIRPNETETPRRGSRFWVWRRRTYQRDRLGSEKNARYGANGAT